MTLEPDQEEDVPSIIDPMFLSLVHQSMTQQQATLEDFPVITVETEPVSPIQMAL